MAADAPATRRSPLSGFPGWLRPGRSPRTGHRRRPAVPTGLVALCDGSAVLIRPVQPADAPLVADGFARLSPRSRQLRFLTGKTHLSSAELRYFTDVDHHDHEALVALNPADGRGVGIARYIRHAGDPHAAEVAVTIVDDWQGRGLGTELVTRLSGRARCEGICRFTALVAEDNTVVARMLGNSSARLAGRGPGTMLNCPGSAANQDPRALRTAFQAPITPLSRFDQALPHLCARPPGAAGQLDEAVPLDRRLPGDGLLCLGRLLADAARRPPRTLRRYRLWAPMGDQWPWRGL